MIWRFLLTGLVCYTLCIPASASHIVGGEINYKCLGNNQYEIILTIYRDCFFGNPSVWFDNPASIGFFNSQNLRVSTVGNQGQILMRLMNNDTLDPVLENECLVIPPNVCVHTTTYRDTVLLPYLAGGYQLVYQRCCRNETIQNIVDPANTGASFYAFISEKALIECNTSAVFNSWPPVYICANEPIHFDHSAFDAEADSIAYRLCTPMSGATPSNPRPQPPLAPPYNPVVWADPFNLDNVLGGVPLAIDPQTGIIIGTPSILGQFVVGICADEYRDGTLISTTRRDFQYNVGQCGLPAAAFVLSDTLCGLRLMLQNMSTFSKNASWIINGPGLDSLRVETYNLDIRLPGPGMFEIVLIADPDTPCSDTAFSQVYVSGSNIDMDFLVEQLSCSDSIDLILRSNSTDSLYAITEITWLLKTQDTTLVFSGSVVDLKVLAVDSIEICQRAVNELGCADSVCIWFFPDLISLSEFERELFICPGDTFNIDIGLLDPSYAIVWTPVDLILEGQQSGSIKVFTEVDTTIRFSVSNGMCNLMGEINLYLLDSVDNLSITADPMSIKPGERSQLLIDFDQRYIYRWQPSGRLDNPSVFNPIANPFTTTIYSVEVENQDGCKKTFEVEVVVATFVCSEEYVFIPNAFTPNGDGINDTWNVRSEVLESFLLIVYDRWGNKVFETRDYNRDWDGFIRGKPANKDIYAFYFEGLCLGGELLIIKGDVSLF